MFNSNTFSVLWWISPTHSSWLAATCGPGLLSRGKKFQGFFMAKMDLSFLFSQHSSSSIVHWHSQPLSRSLVGLVSILSEAHEDICWWALIREHPLLWTLCFDKTFTIMLLSKSRQENWQFLTRLKINKCCLLYWRPEKNGAVNYLFSSSLF